MSTVLLALTLGVNLLFWSSVGLLRWIVRHVRSSRRATGPRVRPAQVAILIAAHNEEVGVADTVASALRLVPRGNVFVVSDGSRDGTVDQAGAAGAVVYDLQPNRGKAGALAAAISHFKLAERFEAVMLLDADTVPAEDYMETGLAMFDDPEVVAVAGHASTNWDRSDRLGVMGQILRAYRERVYVAFQVLLKYGQAARYADCVMIVPGFASMYRTRILESIDIDAQGLAIEDFNMTFEVHAKKLGRVAFHPGSATAYTQDPHILPDYIKQVSRWSLGFWQTVRRHGLHRGRFWVAVAAYVAELLTSSVLFVLLGPALLITLVAVVWVDIHGIRGPVNAVFLDVIAALPPHDYLLGIVIPDYLLTIFVAVRQRRPVYLLLGLAFLPLRCLDALLCLRALWRTRTAQSAGTWTSPTRRGTAPAPVDSAPTIAIPRIEPSAAATGPAPSAMLIPAAMAVQVGSSTTVMAAPEFRKEMISSPEPMATGLPVVEPPPQAAPADLGLDATQPLPVPYRRRPRVDATSRVRPSPRPRSNGTPRPNAVNRAQ